MISLSVHHGSDKYKRLEEIKFLDIQNQTPWQLKLTQLPLNQFNTCLNQWKESEFHCVRIWYL